MNVEMNSISEWFNEKRNDKWFTNVYYPKVHRLKVRLRIATCPKLNNPMDHISIDPSIMWCVDDVLLMILPFHHPMFCHHLCHILHCHRLYHLTFCVPLWQALLAIWLASTLLFHDLMDTIYWRILSIFVAICSAQTTSENQLIF